MVGKIRKNLYNELTEFILFMKIKSKSAAETKKIGAQLGEGLLKEKNGEGSLIFSLQGPLGSGKTTFVKGFASKLGVKKKIKSPTFVLVKKYETPRSGFKFLFHIDCYRLSEKSPDISQIGLEEILNTPNSVVVIEWGEKLKKFFSKNYYEVNFSYSDSQKNLRKIEVPSLFFSYEQ